MDRLGIADPGISDSEPSSEQEPADWPDRRAQDRSRPCGCHDLITRADHPDEACGVIIGAAGSDQPTRLVQMINADRSPVLSLRPCRAIPALSGDGCQRRGNHRRLPLPTATEAYPSRTDIALAAEPKLHYVLVSTAESGNQDGPVEVRSYRILDRVVTEEEIEITE